MKKVNGKKYETVVDRENRTCAECQYCCSCNRGIDGSTSYSCFRMCGEEFFESPSTDLPQHHCKNCAGFSKK
jgi:hypothetical protein